jgi:HK97 family phage portal protein
MAKKTTPIRLRIAQTIAGKSFIPALGPIPSVGTTNRINDFTDKTSQLSAIVGWVSAANYAIVEDVSAVELVLYKKMPDGDKERIYEHEILDLLAQPNAVHSYEQFAQLHHTYVNVTGEGYILMLDGSGEPFTPTMGKLPTALHLLPAHEATLKVINDNYYQSVIKHGEKSYDVRSVLRDLVPDPLRPLYGRSVIAASAVEIDTDGQMKNWNRRFFANEARPGMVFSTEGELSEESYARLDQQIKDKHSGTENAYKPILVENGVTVHPYMLNQRDLDFLSSREFSRDEILAMMRVSPAMLGMVENVNKANMEGALAIHAKINTIPRMRRFVTLLNNLLVQKYDRTLELGFISPLGEDKTAKLEEAKAGVNSWMTIDEVRATYGMEPLPNGEGAQLYIQGIVTPLGVISQPSKASTETKGNKGVEGEQSRPKPRR